MFKHRNKRKSWRKNYSIYRKRKSSSRSKIREYFDKGKKIKWQLKILVLFLLFVLFYIIYFLFFSNYFQIKDIIVTGNQKIPRSEIVQKCEQILNQKKFLFFKNNNYFLFNPQQVEESLREDYLFEYLNVGKKYFSLLEINLKERPYKLFYSIQDRSFLIDQDGTLVSELSSQSQDEEEIVIKELPVEKIVNQEELDKQKDKLVIDHPLYKETNSTSTVYVWEDTEQGLMVKEEDIVEPIPRDIYPDIPQIGGEVFSPEIIENVLYLDQNYQDKFTRPRKYYNYQQEKENLLILVTDDFDIYFKIDENLDSQISNLYRYLIEEGDKGLENIEYIDLRQDGQIIVK